MYKVLGNGLHVTVDDLAIGSGLNNTNSNPVRAEKVILRSDKHQRIDAVYYGDPSIGEWPDVEGNGLSLQRTKLTPAANNNGRFWIAALANPGFELNEAYYSQFSDEFNSLSLDNKWIWDNPTGDNDNYYSLSEVPGFLTINSYGPNDHFEDENSAPKIKEFAPIGNYTIITHLISNPDIAFEHAGIYIENSSASNWFKIIRDSNGDGVYVYNTINYETDGKYLHVPVSEIYLKLEKIDNQYSGYYSLDGSNWILVGCYYNNMKPAYMGMLVVSTPVENNFSSSFDYFRVRGIQ